jgi:hypothetical protein
MKLKQAYRSTLLRLLCAYVKMIGYHNSKGHPAYPGVWRDSRSFLFAEEMPF